MEESGPTHGAPASGAEEPPPVAASESTSSPDVEPEIADFREYLKTGPEPGALRNRIVDFARRPDPRKVKPLAPLLRVRKYDDEVRSAACRGIGRMGDPGASGLLLAVAEDKGNRSRPQVVAAALEGVGDADPRGRQGSLLKFAKSHLDRDAVIASAALRAAAKAPSRELVDDLVRMLEWCSVDRPGAPAEARAAREAVRPVLVTLLRDLTGHDAKDPAGWSEWWSSGAKRTRTPRPPAPPPPASGR
jgi:hypothetical protein